MHMRGFLIEWQADYKTMKLVGKWPSNKPTQATLLVYSETYAKLAENPPMYTETHDDVQTGRRARLFRNGRNQALRIPLRFELPGKEAIIRTAPTMTCSTPTSSPI